MDVANWTLGQMEVVKEYYKSINKSINSKKIIVKIQYQKQLISNNSNITYYINITVNIVYKYVYYNLSKKILYSKHNCNIKNCYFYSYYLYFLLLYNFNQNVIIHNNKVKYFG